jgi:D-alanyl-D-alanine dipeptidase
VSNVEPAVFQSLKSATAENIIGSVIPGYGSPKIICTRSVASDLAAAQKISNETSDSVVVYDAIV